MSCIYCNGTGKYKKPNDERAFERLVDIEMEKADFRSGEDAVMRAYKRVGYTEIDCPYCKGE